MRAKKAQTRELIRAASRRECSIERGFDAVTIADIAQQARGRRPDGVQPLRHEGRALLRRVARPGSTDRPTPCAAGSPASCRWSPCARTSSTTVSRIVGSFVCPDRRAYVATPRRLRRASGVRARTGPRGGAPAGRRADRGVAGGRRRRPPADPRDRRPADRRRLALRRPRHGHPAATRTGRRLSTRAGVPPRGTFAERVLSQMETRLSMISGLPSQLPVRDTGWPESVALQAG